MALKKHRPAPAAKRSPAPPPAPPPADETELVKPGPPAKGMTTEQIRRIGTRIAEHEQDLKSNNTSRRN